MARIVLKKMFGSVTEGMLVALGMVILFNVGMAVLHGSTDVPLNSVLIGIVLIIMGILVALWKENESVKHVYEHVDDALGVICALSDIDDRKDEPVQEPAEEKPASEEPVKEEKFEDEQ